jgi:GNAT superfamily N-acetyltransferase
MIEVRQAQPLDSAAVFEILHEVSAWLDAGGMPMWVRDELARETIEADVRSGACYVAAVDGVVAGTIKFQLTDTEFWPDLPAAHGSAFVHRLAVRRAFAKQGVSTALLAWAADRARSLGRTGLRLDCDAHRPGLRALYERFGFRLHSYRQVGPYYVARYELPLRQPATEEA